MNLNYQVTANVENKGFVLSQDFKTNDESQAVNHFNKLVDYYELAAIKLIVLYRWNGETYLQIKLAL